MPLRDFPSCFIRNRILSQTNFHDVSLLSANVSLALGVIIFCKRINKINQKN